MKYTATILAILIAPYLSAQVSLQSTKLPILTIETVDGEEIPDEPKIDAHLGIIWNGDGATNNANDPFNDYDGRIGIELRGSSSQALFPKKGFAFETRQADGSNNNVSIVGLPEENDWVLHGPYSDKTLMRNALAYELAGWVMDYAPRWRFCEVILNGQYWGVYLLTEKIKRDKNRVDISKLTPDETNGDDVTGGYILKFDKSDGANNGSFASEYPSFPGRLNQTFFQYHYPKPSDLVEEQKTYIRNYIGEVEDVLYSDNYADTINGYRKYFDMEAFYEFIFIQEIARNVDGYRLSSFFSKEKESLGGKIKMGPVWDFNLGFSNVNYCTGPSNMGWALDFNSICPGDSWVIHFWWDRMWEDPIFQKEIGKYWVALRQNEFSTERIFNLIDSMELLLEEPAKRNFQQWPVLGQYVWPNDFIGGSFEAEVQYLREWMTGRLAWLDGQFQVMSGDFPDFNVFNEPTLSPNPTSGQIKFEFNKVVRELVRLYIYDAHGRFIETHYNDSPFPGKYDITIDAPEAKGLYFYRMEFSRGETASGKFIRQ